METAFARRLKTADCCRLLYRGDWTKYFHKPISLAMRCRAKCGTRNQVWLILETTLHPMRSWKMCHSYVAGDTAKQTVNFVLSSGSDKQRDQPGSNEWSSQSSPSRVIGCTKLVFLFRKELQSCFCWRCNLSGSPKKKGGRRRCGRLNSYRFRG